MSTTYAPKQAPAQKKDASSAVSFLDASSQSESLQRKADLANNAAQRAEAPRPNNTEMPDNLKSGIESLSGFSMDDVRVHYNSSKPATVQALAYTQGTDIHVAPGQEKHLPHEAWHVAQQMAGRVSPTTNINGMPINDNAALEHEADVMGEKAAQCKSLPNGESKRTCCETAPVQRFSCGSESKVPLQRKGEIPISIEDFFNENVKKKIEKFNEKYRELFMDNVQNKIDVIAELTIKKDELKDELNKIEEDKDKYKTLNEMVLILEKLSLSAHKNPYIPLSKNGSQSEKKTSDSLETKVNFAFNDCVAFLIKNYDEKHSSFIVNEDSLSGVLDQNMILYGKNQSKTIRDYVNAQIECYPNDFNMQFSILILGCARGIAYLLGDPAAENRIARHLTNTIKEKVDFEKKNPHKINFNQVGALARTNPLLMYLNGEINSQDASHLILVHGMRYFGKIGVKDEKKCFEKMLYILSVKRFNELDAMEKTNSLISGSEDDNFSPAKLGMFGLLRKDDGNFRYDINKKITFEKAKKGFKNPNVKPTTDYTPAWLEKANKHKKKLVDDTNFNSLSDVQKENFLTIKEKLIKAPITIRLHSCDLGFQKDGFYHAKPWFESMEIGDKKISYHPSSGRDGANHYSLWRTYKDNLFRGKLWKKGKDVETQSIAEGAIQQNFGALNYGFESNCYGLIGGYDYGNVSLVLKDSIKSHCLYTLGDKGVSYPDIDSLALALATSTEDKLLKGAGRGMRDTIRNDLINNENRVAEQLEVQIFKDVNFSRDIEKIVCVAVTEEEYGQLCGLVGAEKVTRY